MGDFLIWRCRRGVMKLVVTLLRSIQTVIHIEQPARVADVFLSSCQSPQLRIETSLTSVPGNGTPQLGENPSKVLRHKVLS